MAAYSLCPWVNVDRIDLEQIRRPKRSDDGHVEEDPKLKATLRLTGRGSLMIVDR